MSERSAADGIAAAVLRDRAKALRAQPEDGEFNRVLADSLADSLDQQADELGGAWCVMCGAMDGVPHDGPTKPVPCGECGAPETPDVEVRGIITSLGIKGESI